MEGVSMLIDGRGLFFQADRGDEGGASSGSDSGSSSDSNVETTDEVSGAAFDLAAVRDLILLAHPDAIPELVAGANFGELLGSIEPARAAYQRIVESVQSTSTAAPSPTAPRAPAGGGQRQATPNVDRLSPAAKISEGLRRRQNRGS